MKAFKYLCFSIITLLLFSGCERDDICPEDSPKTPRLVIQFFDVSNPEILKNVPKLKIVAPGNDTLDFDTTSEIKLPLKTSENITEYDFIQKSLSNSPNVDRLIFDYARTNEFVSRACGFRVVYLDFQGTLVNDSNEWIKGVLVEESNINNENETHLNIYH
ncbi:MAG: DUF6452 family protein [Psychroflexus halocasei]